MLKHLTPDELGLCFEGGQEFFLESNLPGVFNPEVFERSWRELIESGRGTIIGLFGGCNTLQGGLGCVIAPCLFTGDLIGVECMWFIRPEYRTGMGAIKLLRAFEIWSKSRQAVRVAMIHLETPNAIPLKRLYEKLHYRLSETHYLKEL